jgi:hypothetical protein
MTVRVRRHRRKTIDEIVEQKRQIQEGGEIPDDWLPDRDGRLYQARIRAWKRPCPKCGAPAMRSCRSAREGAVRWAFHKERWARQVSNTPS